MKRVFFFVLLSGGLLLMLLKFLPLSWMQRIPLPLPERFIEFWRPEILPVETLHVLPPDPVVLDRPRPKWQGAIQHQKQLVSVYKFGPIQARQENIKINYVNHLAAGDTFIAATDVYDKKVLIFTPELKFLRKWAMFSGVASMMKAPIALAAYQNEVAALDRNGSLVIWNPEGKIQASFKIKGRARDLVFLNHDEILVEQTKPYPYLLVVYKRNGRMLRRFAPFPQKNPEEALYLNEAYVDVSPGGLIALGFIYPYRLLYYTSGGKPVKAIKINPVFSVHPPTFHRQEGKIVRMYRQSIIYDVHWFQGFLYVLIASEQAKAASYMDVFTSDGEFIERFYLPINVLKMTSHNNLLYFLGYWPDYRIEAYKIKKFSPN